MLSRPPIAAADQQDYSVHVYFLRHGVWLATGDQVEETDTLASAVARAEEIIACYAGEEDEIMCDIRCDGITVRTY